MATLFEFIECRLFSQNGVKLLLNPVFSCFCTYSVPGIENSPTFGSLSLFGFTISVFPSSKSGVVRVSFCENFIGACYTLP